MSINPPASGLRLDWTAIPLHLRAAVADHLGSPIISARSQVSGFSPGVAARLLTADGQRVFVKAASAHPNPHTSLLHRREARIVSALPAHAPVPRLLHVFDEGDDGWIVLVFEDIDGTHPQVPWHAEELDRVIDAVVTLSTSLTPSPVPGDVTEVLDDRDELTERWWRLVQHQSVAALDGWSRQYLESLIDLEDGIDDAVKGTTLLHLDLRADNMLLTPNQVYIVDWPHARIGAPWIDLAFMAPSVAMQGGPDPNVILMRHPAARGASPNAITALVASIAGYFTYHALQPAPPGLPTVRAFQAAQGAVAREWLAHRPGWSSIFGEEISG